MFFLIFLLLTSIAQADVYVITDNNNAVYSLSSQNDAVIPSGYKLTVLKGREMENLPITGSPILYNFNNGAFILNQTALQAQQAQQQAQIIAEQTRANAKASAVAKLKTLGLTDDEIEALKR